MQLFSSNDSKFDLLRKILQNQTGESAGSDNGNTGGGSGGTGAITVPDIICDTAGAAKQGIAHAAPNGVLIAARAANSGTVYVGGPNTTNGSGSLQGLALVAGGMTPIRYPVSDVSKIFVNADTNGDGVGVIIL